MEEKEKQTRTVKPKEPVKLYKKLVEIRKGVDYLQKKKHKGAAQYAYTSSSQVLAAVREKMNELGVLLIPSVVATNVKENETKTGTKVYFTELMMNMTWIDAESGEKLEVPWYAQGVDLAGEKGPGKGYTYAEKYIILKTFNVPTDSDDPDEHANKNISLVDVKAAAMELMAKASTKDEIAKAWSNNQKLKADKDFIQATKDAGVRVNKPKTDG